MTVTLENYRTSSARVPYTARLLFLLLRLETLDCLQHRRVKHLANPHVAGLARVESIVQVSGAAKPCVLVDKPERRLGRVSGLGPGGDGRVERLHEAVVGREGDDLCDLE